MSIYKSIAKEIKECRVSSVLNNERKLYGKKYLFDGNDETCWNSDKGSPQWIEFSFGSEKEIKELVVQFQGGFAAKSCTLETATRREDDKMEKTEDRNPIEDKNIGNKFEFYPKDTNASQTFNITDSNLIASKHFKLTFATSYDFYGRIIIYNLDLKE